MTCKVCCKRGYIAVHLVLLCLSIFFPVSWESVKPMLVGIYDQERSLNIYLKKETK